MPWNSLKRHNFSETNVISFKVGPFWQRELHFPHIFFFLLKAFLCLWSQIVSQFLCRRSLFKGPFLTQTIFSPLFCIFILWHCCTSQIIWKSKSIWCSVTFPRYFFLSVFGFFFHGSLGWIRWLGTKEKELSLKSGDLGHVIEPLWASVTTQRSHG